MLIMKRIIVDYNKLTNEILSMLVEKYPEGYTDADVIRFKNAKKSVTIISPFLSGNMTAQEIIKLLDNNVKVSIVPRGQALGAAWYLPEGRQITTKEQMLDEMCALFGGRAAEELCTGHISTGAMNDLERATKSAYGMVAYAGMSDALPNVCFYNNQEYQFQRPYSETTAKLIDEEVLRILNEQYNRAKQILRLLLNLISTMVRQPTTDFLESLVKVRN